MRIFQRGMLLACLLALAGTAVAASRSRDMTPATAPATPAASAPAADQVRIQGNTTINAKGKNNTAVAVGEGNTAKNTTGAIKGGTQIKGNTKLNASSSNNTAVAVGKGNKSGNSAGTIGGD